MIVESKICFLRMVVLFAALPACAHNTQPLTWQQRRLEQPTTAELQWERSGHVMIYEGMTDREIKYAMTHHFNRVQGMMFINTVVTGDDGLPLKDPLKVTGDGGSINAISGATITSRAVCSATNDAVELYEKLKPQLNEKMKEFQK